MAAASRRARRRLQRVHRQALRPRPQGPEEGRRRILSSTWCGAPARRRPTSARPTSAVVRRKAHAMSFFVLSFPFSNMGFAQVFPSENAECVCQALKQIFEYVGGVPTSASCSTTPPASAAGSATRCATTETFAAFAAHYGFAYSFCNPHSGHEKGNVESKVRFVTRPTCSCRCRGSADRRFVQREAARADATRCPSPTTSRARTRSSCSSRTRSRWRGCRKRRSRWSGTRIARPTSRGRCCVDGPHRYSTDPSLAGQRVIVAAGRRRRRRATPRVGELVCEHERQYGSARHRHGQPREPAAPADDEAWARGGTAGCASAIPDDLRDYMDGLGERDLGGSLRIMRDQVDRARMGRRGRRDGGGPAAHRQARRGERGRSRGKGGGRLDLIRRARRPRRRTTRCSRGCPRMAVRSKGDAEQLRRLARALYFSNETIEWFLASSSAAQLRSRQRPHRIRDGRQGEEQALQAVQKGEVPAGQIVRRATTSPRWRSRTATAWTTSRACRSSMRPKISCSMGRPGAARRTWPSRSAARA